MTHLWLAAALALLLAPEEAQDPGDGVEDGADPGDGFIATETFELEADRYRRLTVQVSIMGEGPFRFMVDTGAQATVLSAELADRLALTDRRLATLVGIASSRPVETAFVSDVTLGERNFFVRNAPIVEGAHIGEADGILGLDSLQDQRVLIDFRSGEMTVSDSFESGGANSYDIVVRARERLGQLIIHRAEVDGVRTAVIIDTGASASMGNMALERRMRSRQPSSNSVLTDVNGVEATSEVRVARRIEMDRIQLTNIPISFVDSPSFHALDLADRPALIMGMDELRMFNRVAIDFRSRRVLFDMPGDVPGDQAWNFGERASRID
ncbi:MAG: aspartyl protease family protein [Alteraurantiacibacter sp.]